MRCDERLERDDFLPVVPSRLWALGEDEVDGPGVLHAGELERGLEGFACFALEPLDGLELTGADELAHLIGCQRFSGDRA